MTSMYYLILLMLGIVILLFISIQNIPVLLISTLGWWVFVTACAAEYLDTSRIIFSFLGASLVLWAGIDVLRPQRLRKKN